MARKKRDKFSKYFNKKRRGKSKDPLNFLDGGKRDPLRSYFSGSGGSSFKIGGLGKWFRKTRSNFGKLFTRGRKAAGDPLGGYLSEGRGSAFNVKGLGRWAGRKGSSFSAWSKGRRGKDAFSGYFGGRRGNSLAKAFNWGRGGRRKGTGWSKGWRRTQKGGLQWTYGFGWKDWEEEYRTGALGKNRGRQFEKGDHVIYTHWAGKQYPAIVMNNGARVGQWVFYAIQLQSTGNISIARENQLEHDAISTTMAAGGGAVRESDYSDIPIEPEPSIPPESEPIPRRESEPTDEPITEAAEVDTSGTFRAEPEPEFAPTHHGVTSGNAVHAERIDAETWGVTYDDGYRVALDNDRFAALFAPIGEEIPDPAPMPEEEIPQLVPFMGALEQGIIYYVIMNIWRDDEYQETPGNAVQGDDGKWLFVDEDNGAKGYYSDKSFREYLVRVVGTLEDVFKTRLHQRGHTAAQVNKAWQYGIPFKHYEVVTLPKLLHFAEMFLQTAGDAKEEELIPVEELEATRQGLEFTQDAARGYVPQSDAEARLVAQMGAEPLLRDDIAQAAGINAAQANVAFSLLEIAGVVQHDRGGYKLAREVDLSSFALDTAPEPALDALDEQLETAPEPAPDEIDEQLETAPESPSPLDLLSEIDAQFEMAVPETALDAIDEQLETAPEPPSPLDLLSEIDAQFEMAVPETALDALDEQIEEWDDAAYNALITRINEAETIEDVDAILQEEDPRRDEYLARQMDSFKRRYLIENADNRKRSIQLRAAQRENPRYILDKMIDEQMAARGDEYALPNREAATRRVLEEIFDTLGFQKPLEYYEQMADKYADEERWITGTERRYPIDVLTLREAIKEEHAARERGRGDYRHRAL